MAFAMNTDYFYVPGPVGTIADLNTTWWSTYTISGSAVLQKRSGGGSGGVAGTTTTGTAAAMYKFSGMQNNQSIVLTGLNGLANGGTVYLYVRCTDSATMTGYRGTMTYSGGSVAYSIEIVVNGSVTSTLATGTTASYADSSKSKYQLIMNGTTIRWRYAATGGALIDVCTATNATYSSGTPGFGIIDNVGTFNLNYGSMGIDGANLAEANFMNLF